MIRLLLCALVSVSFAGSPVRKGPDVKKLAAELAQNPSDRALREKVIKAAAEIHPALATPDEARRHMVRGQASFEDAKSESDYAEAAAEFQKAVDAAPWLAEAYYNLAVAQDKAGRLAAALDDLHLYLLADLSDKDASAAKDLLYKIEFKKEKGENAAKAQAEAAAAVARAAEDARANWLPRANGATYSTKPYSEMQMGSDRLRVEGTSLHWDQWRPLPSGEVGWTDAFSPNLSSIEGHRVHILSCGGPADCGYLEFNADGSSIHVHHLTGAGTQWASWEDADYPRR